MVPGGDSEEAVEASRSAPQRLVEWAIQQDGWVRAIVAEVLATRRPVPEQALANVRDRYLAEKQLAQGDHEPVPTLGDDGATGDATEPMSLTYLRGCDGVNALATGQDIEFNPRMTLFFGENGAGKTGYVRVLKLLANVRSAEPIIADVHRATAPRSPEALIGFKVGSSEKELSWHGDRGVMPFTRMTVFDSPAVALHLEDNVTYVYTPADLALFKYVYEAIEGVRTLLQADMTQRLPQQNQFLAAFGRETDVYPRIEGLSGSTNLSELETLAAVSDAERTDLDALETSVEALSNESGAWTEMLRSRATVMRSLIT
ncbi:MAG: ATP-binding protein, partial [Actinomycetota bacterium]|nr:ATP-binding protein [Actinomycetota bacterium]